ncbi:MAG: hypothetical protein AAF667_11340 [Pseudomonadota bacterium]
MQRLEKPSVTTGILALRPATDFRVSDGICVGASLAETRDLFLGETYRAHQSQIMEIAVRHDALGALRLDGPGCGNRLRRAARLRLQDREGNLHTLWLVIETHARSGQVDGVFIDGDAGLSGAGLVLIDMTDCAPEFPAPGGTDFLVTAETLLLGTDGALQQAGSLTKGTVLQGPEALTYRVSAVEHGMTRTADIIGVEAGAVANHGPLSLFAAQLVLLPGTVRPRPASALLNGTTVQRDAGGWTELVRISIGAEAILRTDGMMLVSDHTPFRQTPSQTATARQEAG